ncbi:MAG: hypothetical protein IJ615_00010 [Bacteroidaceae bacterium]|nr:hypothetical protein [Bacteroidaceae bacterium]
MKKFLLIAMTVMMAGMTNAQTLKSNKNNKVLPGKPMPALMQAKTNDVIKAAPQVHAKISKGKLDLGKKLTLSQKAQETLKITSTAAKAAPRKASALKESYNASGKNYRTNASDIWTMSTGTMAESGEPCFIDMLPYLTIFGDQGSVAVPYTVDGDKVVVEPTCVGEGEDEQGKYYILLFSAVDEDGCIRMTLDEDGKLATTSGDYFVYGAWDQPEYKYEKNDDGEAELVGYQGYFSMYTGVQYLTEDEIPVPEVRYEPVSTYYHIGSSSSGYGYIANYAVVPPYANIDYVNLTDDPYKQIDTWSWNMNQLDYNSATQSYDVVEELKADTRDFSVYIKPETYAPAQLSASYSGGTTEPFAWGLPYEYQGSMRDAQIFPGELTQSLTFTDGTEATLTRANTKDFGYYYSGSYCTPAKTSRDYTISTLISYQGKPAAPLFIQGVHFGVYQLEANEDFNLKCKIQQMTFDENGDVVLGDVLAESEITYEDLGNIEDGSFDWRNFYVEDEWGMTEEIDYVFVEDEFAVVIEGWDNGTFQCYSLIDGCEFGNVSNTYFIQTGDEDQAIYHYIGNYQHLDLGIYGGWGYLHTDDDTDLIFGKDGGSATIHIDPMFYSTDEETEEPTYSLAIESIIVDEEEAEEIPEWINIEIANEDYSKDEEGNFTHGIDYDMVVTTTALPEDLKSRAAQIVFMQTGAKLTVTVTQDADYDDAITTVVAEPVVKNSRAYNLAGQSIGKTFKGVVVKDGKKVLVK